MVVFTIRAIPNARKNMIEWDATHVCLKVRISAQPEQGKANKAICALFAKKLSLPKSAVTILTGETQRIKRVRIETSLSEETLLSMLNVERQGSCI